MYFELTAACKREMYHKLLETSPLHLPTWWDLSMADATRLNAQALPMLQTCAIFRITGLQFIIAVVLP